MYETFRQTQAYQDKCQEIEGYSLGFTRFKQAKCRCIKPDKWRKCADTVKVQHIEYCKTARLIYKREKVSVAHCPCSKHNDPLFAKVWESTGDKLLLDYVLCQPIVHNELKRDLKAIYSSERYAAETLQNISTLDSKIMNEYQPIDDISARSYNKINSKSVHNTNRAVHSEFLTLQKRQCCDAQCINCGVEKQLEMKGNCVIDNNDIKRIKYRKYIAVDTVTKEGVVKLGTQKVLVQVDATQKTFFDEYHAFLRTKYLPHRWVSKWDNFHRQLLFDSLPYDTLVWHTDFSATYTCMGQDGATCVHDKTAIQAVFVASYLKEIDGVMYQVNDSFHFWGPIDKFSCPSNHQFHNTCVKHIWDHYAHLGRFKHMIGLSDGCPKQYKSQFAVFEMTFLPKNYENLESYRHVYAPTGQFKCCCDACGNDTKAFMRRSEIASNVRADTAYKDNILLIQSTWTKLDLEVYPVVPANNIFPLVDLK